MQKMISNIAESNAESIYLINNAAVISPIGVIDQCELNQIVQHIHVNLLAPMLLTSLFIRYTNHLQIDKRILNISSSSAKHPFPGMSCYSASKAGLDIFSKAVGLEQNHTGHPVKIVSVWPGMIETSLQEEARLIGKSVFPAADLFVKAKDSGILTTPQITAAKLVNLLLSDEFEQGAVVENI